MPNIHVVVLAAGQGKRMKSSLPKVLHRVGGLPMIHHVLRAASELQASSTTVVVGHQTAVVQDSLSPLPDVRTVVQEPQLGTGHALLQTEGSLREAEGTLVLLSGDVPLLRGATLARLVEAHDASGAAATLLTAEIPRPYGYGRVVRSHGRVVRIVEERDASAAQREIREINSGIYALRLSGLFDALRLIASENAQGEYYLPDLIGVYRRRKLTIEAIELDRADEIRGINSRTELAEVSRIVRQGKNEELMAAGVTIEDPLTTYIDPDVTVGPDTVIHPGVTLEGRTHVGAACELHSGVRIVDSTLGDGVTVNNHCVILGSRLDSGVIVGPFAHLRPGSELRDRAKVGNFVEMKKAVLGAGSKANHLTYLGDATIGSQVNVGAGTIICNYDGEQKHQTTIEDGAFIGSDTQLVAPVTIGRGAYVASGSCITDDVPAGALAIARGRQVNKADWVAARKTNRS